MITLWSLILLLASSIGSIIALLYIYTECFCHNYWKKKNVHHLKPTPIVGSFSEVFARKMHVGQYLAHLYTQHSGPYFGIYLFGKPFLILRDPDIIKTILVRDANIFCNKNFGSNLKSDPLTANSVFILKGREWKLLREKLSAFFTPSGLKTMFKMMNECGKDLSDFAAKNDGRVVEMKEVFSLFTIDMISSCGFGLKTNSFENDNSELQLARREAFEFSIVRGLHLFGYFFAPHLVRWFGFQLIPDKAAKVFRRMFTESYSHKKATKVRRNDFVDRLLELQEEDKSASDFQFDYERMVAQAVMFFTAGFETTSTSLAFAFYELCVNQDVQQKAREEIIQVLKRHNGEITYEGLMEMNYVDMVLSEAQRKYPAVPFINRQPISDYLIKETGLVIDKNVTILVPTEGLHSDPLHFPDPSKYDPERFNEQNKKKIRSGTYLPFGEGPRNCIGKRLALVAEKLSMFYLLKDFEVVKCELTPDPIEFDPQMPTLASKSGLRMKIRKLVKTIDD